MTIRSRNALGVLLIAGALLAGTTVLAQKKNTPSPVGPNGPVGPNRPGITPPLIATPLPNLFAGASAVVNVSSPASLVFEPHEAADGNNVYAVWRSEGLPSGPYGISISVSHDGGHTFSPPQIVVTGDVPNSGSPTAIWGPDVAAGGGHVWVSYFLGGALNLIESVDGIHFAAPRVLSRTADVLNERVDSVYQYGRMVSLPGACGIVWGESTRPADKADKGKFDTNPIIKFLRVVPTTDWKTTAVVAYQTTTPQPIVVSRLGVHATMPSVYADGSKVRVVFLEQQGDQNVASLAQSNNAGISFDTIASAAEARCDFIPSGLNGAQIGDIAKPIAVVPPPPSMPVGASPISFNIVGDREFLAFERLAIPAAQLASGGSGGFFRNPALGVSWSMNQVPSIVSMPGSPRFFWSDSGNVLQTASFNLTAGLVNRRSLPGGWQYVQGLSLNTNALVVDWTHMAVFGGAGLSPTVPVPFTGVAPQLRQFLPVGNHEVAFWIDHNAVDENSTVNPLHSMVIGG